MSQEISKQKLRWLRRIFSVRAPSALWLAPALLSPILTTAGLTETAHGQAPSAARSISDAGAPVNAEFVMGWLEYAGKQAEQGNTVASAKAWAEALRGRKLLPAADTAVETRLKEVQDLLLSKGVTRQHIADAIGTLGALSSAPNTAAPKTGAPQAAVAGLPQLPSMNPQPAGSAGASDLPTPGMLAPVTQASALSTPPSNGVQPAAGTPTVQGPVKPGIFFPASDQTSTQPASSQIELSEAASLGPNAGGEELYRRGVELLSQGQSQAAYDLFRRAWQYEREMDPALRNQLKDKLSSMQVASGSDLNRLPLHRCDKSAKKNWPCVSG